MSGIAGVVLTDSQAMVHPVDLSAMVRALSIGQSGPSRALVHGFIGLGAQGPAFHTADVAEKQVLGQLCAVAFCGRLYQPARMRSEMEPVGTLCDDLLQLYLDNGLSLLERLRGEFVFAIWDGRDEALYLITDRFRVNPLYYTEDTTKLVFGSRIDSIRALLGDQGLSINPQAVLDVMAYSAIPTPRSIFNEVKKLPPGCILTSRRGETRISSYWDGNFLKPDRVAEVALGEELKRTFEEALACRMHDDTARGTIGAFLSGGIDSSTVTGMLTALSKHQVKCFSIGFAEQQFNEMEFARTAARHFGAEHIEYQVSPRDTVDAIPTILESFDEPFANASAVPTYYCAKVAKEHGVTVLYAGDGGDELFAGNERYREQRLFDYYGYLPRWMRKRIVEPMVQAVAGNFTGGLVHKAEKYIRRANIPYPQRLTSYGFFNLIAAHDLFEPDMLQKINAQDPYEAIGRHYFNAPANTELDRQMYIDWKVTLADIDIPKVVRMTEAAGVGVRFPFLDHRLAEFATRVPADIRMRGRTLRSFFKKTYADLLPAAVLAKTKHGFGLPIPVWLRTYQPLREMMLDLVLSPRSLQRGYFRRSVLERIVRLHESDQTSFYGTVLWNIMALELWHRSYTASSTQWNE